MNTALKAIQKFLFLISTIHIFLIACSDKTSNEYFAAVKDYQISVDEFARRLKFFTRTTGIADNLQTRENLLNQMINERLLIQDFDERNLQKSQDFIRKAESIRNQYYLDAFRKTAFYDTISVSDQEIQQKYLYYSQRVSARHLYAQTEDEANELYNKLQAGASFDELARLTFQDAELASNGGYLGYFGKGDMDPAFERAAFSLKIGDVSEPVQTQYGYSIIKVEDRFIKPLISESELLDVKAEITDIVKKEKSITCAQKYGNNLAKELNLSFDENIMKFLFELMNKEKGQSFISFDPEQQNLNSELNHIMDQKILSFESGEWKVKDFLEKARSTSPRQRNRIKNVETLKHFAAGLALRDILVKKAIQKGVAKNKKLQYEINHAIDGYKVAYMTKIISDTTTVPFEAVKEEYEKNPENYMFPEQANIREILLSDKNRAEFILNEIKHRKNFSDLAKKYSERQWSRDKGGELGWAPRSKYGALADTVFSMKPGDVIGPIEIEGYYSIIQLIDKIPEKQKSIEEAASQIETEILWKWRKIRLHNEISTLRDKTEINILTDKLRWYSFKEK